MGKAVGESLCPNNESLESMQVRSFQQRKNNKMYFNLGVSIYIKKKKRKFKTSVLYCVLGGSSFPSIKRLAHTRSSVFVFHFHAENVLIFLHLKTSSLYHTERKSLVPKFCFPKLFKTSQVYPEKDLTKKTKKHNTTCKTSTNLI